MEKDANDQSTTSKEPSMFNATQETGSVKALVERMLTPAGYKLNPAYNKLSAKSDAKRTVNPRQAGQQSDDCGQLVRTSG